MIIDDLPGYSPIKKINKGGMSDLWIALDSHQRKVVVRFIKEMHVGNKPIRKAFENGIKVLEKLEHDNIVRLMAHGKHKSAPYMVIEYYPNLNLRERIVKRSEILVSHQLILVRQLAKALNYMHREGFLHQDIKPENILILDDGSLILVDFDLAIPHKGKPIKLKMLHGTPAYLAPETLMEKSVDERSEVYSFGVTMYELLTWHKPYEGSSIAEYQRAVVDKKTKPRPMSDFRKGIPSGLEQIIGKCLDKNVETRYPAMALVLRDLNGLL